MNPSKQVISYEQRRGIRIVDPNGAFLRLGFHKEVPRCEILAPGEDTPLGVSSTVRCTEIHAQLPRLVRLAESARCGPELASALKALAMFAT